MPLIGAAVQLVGNETTTIIGTVTDIDGYFRQERYFLQNTEEEFTAPYADVDNTENRYSLSTYVNKKFNARWTARVGILAELYDYDLNALDAEEGPDTDGDGMERSTAFNNSYVLNVLAGKEWQFGPGKRNAFTIDTKVTTAGGLRYTPTDLAASRVQGFQVDVEELAFSERFDSYFRWDLKFGVTLNSSKRKLSHRFYLDFQNLTNQENIFVRRYNRQTNEVNEVFQRGFFPDFLYRIQF